MKSFFFFGVYFCLKTYIFETVSKNSVPCWVKNHEYQCGSTLFEYISTTFRLLNTKV